MYHRRDCRSSIEARPGSSRVRPANAIRPRSVDDPEPSRLRTGAREPDEISGSDVTEALCSIPRVLPDHEQPPARVDDDAPVSGPEICVGRDPASASRARDGIDLDSGVSSEAGIRELRLAN